MFIAYLGHIAAMGTSLCWSFTSVFFTLSGRIVGSAIVNRTRLIMAVVFASITHWIMQGTFLPVQAEAHHWLYLGLSGIIGYVLGDGFLFQAFVMIGPRLSMLLMALGPVFSVLLGWLFLQEALGTGELLGIALAIGGVMVVVGGKDAEQSNSVAVTSHRQYVIGVLFGLGGAFGQAGGLFFSKLGVADGFSTLSGNMIRIIVASIILWAWTIARGGLRPTFTTLKQNPNALKFITGGAIFGPFLGVWLSLIAVQNAPLGIASTLTSLAPIMLLPISRVLFKEKITPRAIWGTVIAFTGVTVIFLAPLLQGN